MRKLSIFLTVIAAILLTVSCSTGSQSVEKTGPGVTFKQPHSQQYVDHAPITEPRYSCSGKRMAYPKLIGMREINVLTSQEVYNVPDSLIRANGYEYSGNDAGKVSAPSESLKNPLKTSSFLDTKSEGSDWLMELIKLLFAAMLVGLTLYFLWWLFNRRFHSSSEAPRNTANDFLHNHQPNVTVVVDITQANPTASSNFEKDAMNHHLNVIKEMQKSGGRTDFELNSFSFSVEVPAPTDEKKQESDAVPK